MDCQTFFVSLFLFLFYLHCEINLRYFLIHFDFFFRESFDKLSQKAQFLNEKGYTAGREIRLASEHFAAYQNLVKTVKEKLRASQVALQEHQALEEALQNMWAWVKHVQEKLASSESTIGSRETLQERLLQLQVGHWDCCFQFKTCCTWVVFNL